MVNDNLIFLGVTSVGGGIATQAGPTISVGGGLVAGTKSVFQDQRVSTPFTSTIRQETRTSGSYA